MGVACSKPFRLTRSIRTRFRDCDGKIGCFGSNDAVELSSSVEADAGGCFLIENAGYAEISTPQSDLKRNDSIASLDKSEVMKIDFSLKNSFAEKPVAVKQNMELSFVRGLISNLKKRSPPSTISSVDSDCDRYHSYPVDDDLFESSSSNRVSFFSNASDKSSPSSETGDGLNSTPAVLDNNGERGESILKTLDGRPEEGNPKSKYRRSRSRAAADRESKVEKRRSYYVPGDDISPDFVCQDLSIAWSEVPNGITTPVAKYSLPDMQPCEVWGEVGPEGGVLQIHGSGISLHFLSTSKVLGTNSFKAKRLSEAHIKNARARRSSDVQSMDRRVVLCLEDAPEIVNSDTSIAVGSMICVDYGDFRIASSGLVLQVDVNASLKDRQEDLSSTICEYGCRMATSSSGPFEEVSGDCYQIGNALQVTISYQDIEKLTENCLYLKRSLRLVPVVKIAKKVQAYRTPSVWDGISCMAVWAGVYGPKRPQLSSTCCVSISTATTCPPTLPVAETKTNGVLLHLWTAYRVSIRQPEDIRIRFQADPESTVSIFPTHCDISANEVSQTPRINKLFGLEYAKDYTPLGENNARRRYVRFLLNLTGQESGLLSEMRFVAPVRTPLCPTPVKRWKRYVCRAPPKSACDARESRTKDYLYLWHDAQREATSKLAPVYEIPGTDKQVFITKVAVAVTTRVRGKRQKVVAPLLAEYAQSETIPILSKESVWCYGTIRHKEWYVGYVRGKVGLVHTQCARTLNTDRCFDEGNGKITVGQLIEDIVEPVADLCFCFDTTRQRLIERVNDWIVFSSILRFGKNYICRVVKEINDDSKRETEDKLSLFLEKYKEFCLSGPSQRSIPKDIVRALLYMGQHKLATSLVTDFCVLSVAVKVGERWRELKTVFGTLSTKDIDIPKGKSLKRTSMVSFSEQRPADEISWIHAFDWLSSARQSFANNDRAFLVRLHRALDALPDSSNRTWSEITGALVLLLCIDSLSKYEARL